uniref:NAD(+) diphosphatase n=1 Tax=Hanusia phi TaxID=3032 RepID=A0A7S0HYT4_9CRYP
MSRRILSRFSGHMLAVGWLQQTFSFPVYSPGLRIMSYNPPLAARKMSMKDAGYSFEDYREKRSTFEPTARRLNDAAQAQQAWPNYYSCPSLQKDLREKLSDEAEFKHSMTEANARFILVWRGKNLFKRHDNIEDFLEPIFLRFAQVESLAMNEDVVKMYIGEMDSLRYFALDVSTLELDDIAVPQGGFFEQLRTAGGILEKDDDAGLLATARGLSVWHRSLSFCSNCGSGNLRPDKAGSMRRCRECKSGFYPRIDPSVIVLVSSSCGKHALLGRKAVWPTGRYSVLAGFTEVGESLEETVIREVYEESGVAVDPNSIRFFSSQSWPFPRSLMIAFTARAVEAADGKLPAINIDENEMDDVKWFSREDIEKGLAAEQQKLSIPGRAAVAHALIMDWMGVEKNQ